MRTLIYLGLILILITSVTALGIAPAKTEIIVTKDVITGKFNIVNDEGKLIVLKIKPESWNGGDVELSKEILTLTPDDVFVPITFTIRPYQGFTDTELKILVEEDKIEGEGIRGKIKIPHKISLIKPVHKELHVQTNSELNNKILQVRNTLWNFADHDLQQLIVKNSVYDQGLELTTKTSIKQLLEKGAISKQVNKLDAEELAGIYTLETNVEFEKEEILIAKKIKIKEPDLDINIPLGNIIAKSSIAQINLEVNSNWNEPIETDFTLEVLQNGRRVNIQKSQDFEINPGKNVVTLFLDSTNIEPSNYELQIEARSFGKLIGNLLMPLEIQKVKRNEVVIPLTAIIGGLLLITNIIFIAFLIKKKSAKKNRKAKQQSRKRL